MTRFLTIVLCMMALNACANDKIQDKPANMLDQFFNKTDTFLKANINDGKVPYNAIQEEPKKLNELVKMVGNISLENASRDEKKAFYINAYNILTIHSIIENNIPSSPMDIDGFFDKNNHEVAGEMLTLDGIEKGILFPEFKDPRVHFAVVCAALGCPQIQPEAYKPDKLEDQLNQATRKTLNREYFIRVKEGKVEISEIFKWYKKDFLNEADSVLAYINQYRSEKIPSDFKVGYYSYDWSLNKL